MALRFALLLLVVSVVASTAHGDNVLFIGNSFTFAAMAPVVERNGGVPKLFEEIARAKGKDVTAEAVTKGGQNWTYHLAQPVTEKALEAKVWSYVVLQDFSQRPTHAGDITGFMRDGEVFSDRIAVHSPQAGIVLYETWARPPAFYQTAAGHDFTDAGQMLGELHDNYAKLQADLAARNPKRPALDAEVGTAFARAKEEIPGIRLDAIDAHHATAEGYYLAALVFYATIYHDSAVGAPSEFFNGKQVFPADVAAKLQKVADEVSGTAPKE